MFKRALIVVLCFVGCEQKAPPPAAPAAAPAPKVTYLEACELVRQEEAKLEKLKARHKELSDVYWEQREGSPEKEQWRAKREEVGLAGDEQQARVERAEKLRDSLAPQ